MWAVDEGRLEGAGLRWPLPAVRGCACWDMAAAWLAVCWTALVIHCATSLLSLHSPANSLPCSYKGLLCRLLACVAVVFICWDIKAVFYTVWWPFKWCMGYVDPRKPTDDVLHGEPLCKQSVPAF